MTKFVYVPIPISRQAHGASYSNKLTYFPLCTLNPTFVELHLIDPGWTFPTYSQYLTLTNYSGSLGLFGCSFLFIVLRF